MIFQYHFYMIVVYVGIYILLVNSGNQFLNIEAVSLNSHIMYKLF